MTEATVKAGRATADDAAHRRDANRAVGFSAAGLALTGLVELLLAIITGSVALLGRWMGRTLLLEVEAHLDGSVSLAEAGQICRQAEAAVTRAVPAAGRVHCDAHP